jgi:hypothetical protein
MRAQPRRSMTQPISREEEADALREQAASCRRLARHARTNSGASGFAALADQFDADARRIDPLSFRR